MTPIYTYSCIKCGRKKDIISSVHGEFIEHENICECGKGKWRRLKGVTGPSNVKIKDGTPKFYE